MRVVLIHSDQEFPSAHKDLATGRRMLFGSGRQADFGVSGEDVAPLHFQIAFDGNRVRLKNLAAAKAPVLVNGAPIDEADLFDNDVVQVGRSQVAVRITGAVAAASDEAEDASDSGITLQNQDLPTGLTHWIDPTATSKVIDVIDQLLEKFEPVVAANFRAAKLAMPDWLEESSDLLGGAPATLRAEASLHLFAADDIPIKDAADSPQSRAASVAELIALYAELRKHDAASILWTTASKDETVEAIHYHRGFFSRARSLEMFLQQGSPDLAQKLMAGAAAILIAGAAPTDWSLYANPELAPTAPHLGLLEDQSISS